MINEWMGVWVVEYTHTECLILMYIASWEEFGYLSLEIGSVGVIFEFWGFEL